MYAKKVLIPIMAVVTAVAISGCTVPFFSEREIEIQADKEFEALKAEGNISTDVKLRNFVWCVARPIFEQTPEPYGSLDWDIVIIDDDLTINAFAMPGGKIAVYTGILLDVIENQHQLAAVLGHEIAHVTERHSYERVNRAAATQMGAYGVGAVLGGGAAGEAVLIGAQLGLNLPFSRAEEAEADRVGLAFSAAAGFDPRESVPLWKNMARENQGGPPEFLSSHPSDTTRIENLIGELGGALVTYNAAVAAGQNPQCDP